MYPILIDILCLSFNSVETDIIVSKTCRVIAICDVANNDVVNTVYSGYSGHDYSGHSDIVATFPGTKFIYSIAFRSDIVANRI